MLFLLIKSNLMKKYTIFLFFFISLNAFAQWCLKNPLYNYGRTGAVSFTINDVAFVGLGNRFDSVKLYDFWKYDPQTDLWEPKSTYPGAGSYSATSFSINSKGYICLGADSGNGCTSELWEYNPESDLWLRKTDFPGIARYGAGCFVLGDTAFIIGGSHNVSSDYLYDVWMYISSTDTWQQLSDFPGGKRNHGTGFSINGYGYYGTGYFDATIIKKDFWKYDKNNDTWTQIPDIPGPPLMSSLNFVINGIAYVGTGSDGIAQFKTFWPYNPATNSWQEPIVPPDNFIPRRLATSFSINNTGYVTTGYTTIGMLDDLWAFSPNISEVNENEKEKSPHFSIYPNPADDHFRIKCNDPKIGCTIIMFDSYGKIILNQFFNTDELLLDIENINPGIYFIQLMGAERTERIKLIIV